jgi:hydrogen peroxide-dependent heme synthase
MSRPAAGPESGHVDPALNRTVRYAAWAVYARSGAPLDDPRAATEGLGAWARSLAAQDVVLRGCYDVSGLRAGSDVMLWLHGPGVEPVQAALRAFRRTRAGSTTVLAWSAMGTHRPAEFSADHVPSFMLGTDPLRWLCVYPFVRSYEWYLLPEEDRRAMLREHGMAGRTFTGVQANTVASFALGDWEWILALESDDLHELVDLMRDLRATQARRHVREEVPFHTGRLIDLDEVVEVLR